MRWVGCSYPIYWVGNVYDRERFKHGYNNMAKDCRGIVLGTPIDHRWSWCCRETGRFISLSSSNISLANLDGQLILWVCYCCLCTLLFSINHKPQLFPTHCWSLNLLGYSLGMNGIKTLPNTTLLPLAQLICLLIHASVCSYISVDYHED